MHTDANGMDLWPQPGEAGSDDAFGIHCPPERLAQAADGHTVGIDWQSRAEKAETELKRAEEQLAHLGSWKDAQGRYHDLTNPTCEVQDIIDGHLASKQRCAELAAALKNAGDALEMLYGQYEEGPPCYEDVEEGAGFLGNAVNLSQEEDNTVLAALELCGIETALRLKPETIPNETAILSAYRAQVERETLERVRECLPPDDDEDEGYNDALIIVRDSIEREFAPKGESDERD